MVEGTRQRITPQEFADKLRKLPKEFIDEQNKRQLDHTEAEWKEFRKAFKSGICYLCSKPLKTFSIDTPCLHWLLRPNKFKKKHFNIISEKFSCTQVESFIRWVASIDNSLVNINDIVLLKDCAVIQMTARYKHITWSISCKDSDFKGHKTTTNGNFPHYHFQMRLNNMAFIDYGDFHIPLHERDILKIELIRNNPDMFKSGIGPGAGIGALLNNEEGLKLVIETSVPTDNEDTAAFSISTMIEAPEGEKLSGEELYKAFKEAKDKGRTITSVMKERFPEAKITAIVNEGKGVAEAMPRTRRGT